SDPAGSSVDYEVFDFSEVLILCVDDFTADHRLLGWNYICVSAYSRFCDGFHVYTSLLKGSWLTRLLPPPHGKRDENGYLFTSRHIRVLFTSLERRNRQETLPDLPPTAGVRGPATCAADNSSTASIVARPATSISSSTARRDCSIRSTMDTAMPVRCVLAQPEMEGRRSPLV